MPSKVQFDKNLRANSSRKADAIPSPRDTSISVAGPENTMVSNRAVNSSSCTGGSTDAKKAGKKFISAQYYQSIKTGNGCSAKKMQISTNLRLNNLDASRKPVKQNFSGTGNLKL